MQRNRFLPDILTTLFDSRRAARSDGDPRDIFRLNTVRQNELEARGAVS